MNNSYGQRVLDELQKMDDTYIISKPKEGKYTIETKDFIIKLSILPEEALSLTMELKATLENKSSRVLIRV